MNLKPLMHGTAYQAHLSSQGQASWHLALPSLDKRDELGQKTTRHEWFFVRDFPHKLISLTSHLQVSTIVLLMGQKVNPFVNSGNASGLTTSRRNERSFEYPSGLGALLHKKAEYMTEATAASNNYLAFSARSIHDAIVL